MKKEFYSELKTKLETDLANDVQHVALWNSQIDNEQIEKPFRFPALFIEFVSIEYRSETQGAQKCDVEFTIHCCFSQLVDDIDLLDVVQKVALSLHGSSGTFYSAITRTNEQHDVNHDRVIDWQISFQTTMTDETTVRENSLIQINSPAVVSLEIIRDLDIDNPIIRSGDGQ